MDIMLRQWRVNLLQLVQAALFMFVIWLITKALSYSNELSESYRTERNPKAESVDNIPLCTDNIYLRKDAPCHTFIYSPNNDSDVEAIVRGVLARNRPPIPPSSVLALPSMDAVDQYLLDHPQTVLATLNFFPNGGQSPNSLGYILQTNSTAQFFKGKFQHPNKYIQVPLQVAVEREATRLMVAKSRGVLPPTSSLLPGVSIPGSQLQLAPIPSPSAPPTAPSPNDSASGTGTNSADGTQAVGAMNSTQAAQDWFINRDGSIDPLLNGTYANVTGLSGSSQDNATSVFNVTEAAGPSPSAEATGPMPSSNPFAALLLSPNVPSSTSGASLPALASQQPNPGATPGVSGAGARRLQQDQTSTSTSAAALPSPPPLPPVMPTPAPTSPDFPPSDWEVSIQIFAHPATVLQSFVGRIAPTFIFASAMFSFVLVLYAIVQEKELGLRQAMETMGLSRGAFWTVWCGWEFLMAGIGALVIQALGYAFQFDLWYRNDFALTFLLVLENNLALVAFAVLCSTFMRSAGSTVVVGFIIFFLAWIMIIVIGFGFPYVPNFDVVFRVIFSLFPWSLLTVGFTDLGNASVGASGEGLRWEDRDSYCFKDNPSPAKIRTITGYYKVDCTTSVNDCLIYMALQIPAYLLLALYFDFLLPDAIGNTRHPLFFLTPSFWGIHFKSRVMHRIRTALRLASDLEKPQSAALQSEQLDSHQNPYPSILPKNPASPSDTSSTISDGTDDSGSTSTHPGPAVAAKPTPPTPTPSIDPMVLQEAQDVIALAKGYVDAGILPTLHRPVSDPLGSSSEGRLDPKRNNPSSDRGGTVAADHAYDAARSTAGSKTGAKSNKMPSVSSSSYSISRKLSRGGSRRGGPPEIPDLKRLKPLQTFEIDVADELTDVSLGDGADGKGKGWTGGGGNGKDGSSYGVVKTGAGVDSGTGALPKPAAALFGLSRSFVSHKFLWFGRREFKAVQPTWLSLRQGECLCLLGPNGAGKTTTIRMMTGVLGSSGGDALVWGNTITTPEGMRKIRQYMGVCPQFDVLYADLTALEHLLLFAAIKGIPGGHSEWERQAFELLREVKLDDVAHKRAGQFSGGMRRRLSVAISLLGDPLILYLDEPSTGMDPISRRHIWTLIDRISKDRAVVLTTHSMQEADVLGDRIAIMARGKLRALGTSLQLKERYGSGYRLTLLLDDAHGKPMGNGNGNASGSPPGSEGPMPSATPEGSKAAQAPGSTAAPPSGPVPPSSRYSAVEMASTFVRTQLPGLEPVASGDADAVGAEGAANSLTYAVPHALEGRIGELLEALEVHGPSLGIRDSILTSSPLEEVFLRVVRTAEVENARESNARARVLLAEVGAEVEVAVGAAEVVHEGVRYRCFWAQDEEGKLHCQRTERM